MLNKKLINRKIELIQNELDHLEAYSEFTFVELVSDWEKLATVERLLERVIGRAIDVNQHLIIENGGKITRAPLSYKETFLRLVDLKIYPKEFAEEISKSASFRNILVHEYNGIDEQLIYNSVKDAVSQYSRYCDYILKYLDGQ